MNVPEVFNAAITYGPQLAGACLMICGGAAMIAALTPTPVDDGVIASVVSVIKKVSDVLGWNVLNAKNK